MTHKKKVMKSLRIFWIAAGIILTTATLFSFIKNQTTQNLAATTKTLFFAAGLYALIIYLITTMILILSQEIIKRVRQIHLHEQKTRIEKTIY